MPHELYLVSVTVHVMAAIFWLGGMFFLGMVGAPLLRMEDSETRRRLFHALGLGFRRWAWWALTLMVVTGVANSWVRGYLRPLNDVDFWGSRLGMVFGAKIVLVVAMLVLSAVHDFSLGPRAGEVDPESEEAARLRRMSVLNARVNGGLAIVLVYVAVRLARGG
jgi:copper resistance protein D